MSRAPVKRELRQPTLARRALGELRASGGTPALSGTELQIKEAVDARNEDGVALLERLVNINSGTKNLEGVKQVGQLLRQELDALGFKTRWVDGAPFGRAGHLVAERSGNGPRILLIGHLDTVFEASSKFQKFERLSKTLARGPGIMDMKGGDVVMIQALKALAAAGALDDMSLSIVFSGDEEASGNPRSLSRADLLDAAIRSKYAVGFEAGGGDPHTALTSRRGSTTWQLSSTGVPAHSSQIGRPDVGFGAILESARALNEIRQELAAENNLTFSPGVALGGNEVSGGSATGKNNIIARQMKVSGDLRPESFEQLERAKKSIREILRHPLPNTASEISFRDGYPPLAATPGSQQLLDVYDRTSRDLGLGRVRALGPERAGAADISFTAGRVTGALDAIGLPGSGEHTEQETADLGKLASTTQRAAIFLYRLSKTG